MGRSAEICFKYLEDTDADYNLNNFELAGTDGIFHAAAAVRKGNRVSVFSDRVDVPTSVRYAWSDNPNDLNFYNDAGLPAGSFRLEL
jgi:sialate O-acetylesterase